MKQKYAVVVLFALIIASSMVSLTSYRQTEVQVTKDMNQALAKALEVQQSDVISADTIQVFNSYLQMDALKGQAVRGDVAGAEKGLQRLLRKEQTEVRTWHSRCNLCR